MRKSLNSESATIEQKLLENTKILKKNGGKKKHQ